MRPINCFIVNYDAIMREKDPKYTPLTQSRSKRHRNRRKLKEDNIDSMEELYKIKCEAIRMSNMAAFGVRQQFDSGDEFLMSDEL